jgi:ankyrin repeat protein
VNAIDDEALFSAARDGDTDRLRTLLDDAPERLTLRQGPYQWSLLHLAAHCGQLPVVELLLERGLPPDVREQGDNTTPMHWAAAAGQTQVVRRLIEAGADVVGGGDDHALEIIGWATCWDGCDDEAHREVVDLLLRSGARHHIFSAVAAGREAEVRRLVNDTPGALTQRMSRNENHQLPLHLAVRMNRPEMVALLMELGADPLGVDGSGSPVWAYATSPRVDRPVMEALHARTMAERKSAERGMRSPNVDARDLVAALALYDTAMAEWIAQANPATLEPSDLTGSAIHLMAKRGDERALRWLIEHGAQVNARWSHWGAEVTPLHLAILGGHPGLARALLEAGADPAIRDSQHDGDARGWAEFFGREEILRLLA